MGVHLSPRRQLGSVPSHADRPIRAKADPHRGSSSHASSPGRPSGSSQSTSASGTVAASPSSLRPSPASGLSSSPGRTSPAAAGASFPASPPRPASRPSPVAAKRASPQRDALSSYLRKARMTL